MFQDGSAWVLNLVFKKVIYINAFLYNMYFGADSKKDMNMSSLLPYVNFEKSKLVQSRFGSVFLQNLEKQQMLILHKPLIQKIFKWRNNYYAPQRLIYL